MNSLATLRHGLLEVGWDNPSWFHYLRNYIHITGGLSKDFGLSGFRIGIVYTLNEEIQQGFSRVYGYLLNASTHTQYLVAKIFGDEAWLEKYIKLVRKRLTISNAAVVDALKAIDVPCFEGEGTLSVWADFRSYLKE